MSALLGSAIHIFLPVVNIWDDKKYPFHNDLQASVVQKMDSTIRRINL